MIFIIGCFGLMTLNRHPNYNDYINDFSAIRVEEIEARIDKSQSTLIYIGRKTCPYCVAFAPMLHNVSNKQKIEIHYLDTENESTSMKKFRETHQIMSVPALIYITREGSVLSPAIPENEKSLEELLTYLAKK